MAFCPTCGTEIPDGATCPRCPVAAAPGSATAPSGAGLSDNLAGALAYLTIIPAIVFLVIEPFNRRRFVRFHAFQCIFFWVAWTVLWIGLPPMKDPGFASRVDLVNRLQYSIVSASPHAIWVSSAGVIGDDHGAYRDFGNVHNKPERLRAADGIHISDDGAELIAARLLPWLAAQSAKDAKPPQKEKSPTPASAGAGDSNIQLKP